MAITGTPASGTITVAQSPSQAATYAGQNVIIPNAAAGIGDIVLKSGDTIKIMAGSTYASTPSGYTLMGVIYGFEEGGAMVVAPSYVGDTSSSITVDGNTYSVMKAKWATTTTGGVSIETISGLDQISASGVSRNGLQVEYSVMNIKTYKGYVGSNSGTKLHPTSIWADSNGPMSITNFNSDLNQAKSIYKTYEAYLAQGKPMGAGNSAFSRKYHKGRNYTRILKDTTTSAGYTFPAAQYCWNYGAGDGTYWLPDMVELLQLMNDETLECINKALKKCGTPVCRSDYHWSSVRYNAAYAWSYNNVGFSDAYSLYRGFHCRPVTLLKI